MNDDTILNISDLSKYLKISKSLIRIMVSNGEIPYFKIHNRILFRFGIIKEWLSNK